MSFPPAIWHRILVIFTPEILLVSLAISLSLLLTLFFTPLAMRLAVAAGVIDQPDARRVHTTPTPRWGGLAIASAFLLTILVLAPVREWLQGEMTFTRQIEGMFAGTILMTLVGALDDKYSLPAKVKLLGQIAAACILPLAGVRFHVIFNIDLTHQAVISAILTVGWVVAVTNTINLIDGLDGLAAGISGIAALTFLIVSVVLPATTNFEKMMPAALLGACIGFLFYNFHPARVFMGDAGSHFLGFTLAALSVYNNFKLATGITIIVPLLVLAVPIFDTAFAIIRRLLRRQPIFSADKEHLHHRLLNLGLHQRAAVLTIYILTALSCAIALILTRARLPH